MCLIVCVHVRECTRERGGGGGGGGGGGRRESEGLRLQTKHNRMNVPPLRNPCSVSAFQSTIFSPAEQTVAKGYHHTVAKG